MLCSVVVGYHISEVHAASIFRVKWPLWVKTAYIWAQTGEGWQLPLASRKCRGSDPAATATSMRRES
jgi:hypothetical protein